MLQSDRRKLREAGILAWHEAGYTGKNVTIAVLDGWGLPRPADHVFSPVEDPSEDEGHKTNACGVIRQIAPDAKLIAFNWWTNSVEATAWLKRHHTEIDLINVSIYTVARNALEFHFLRKYKIPLLCATGNDGKPEVHYPARFPWTIGIGSFQQGTGQMYAHSNYGDGLDCVAFTDLRVPVYEGEYMVSFERTSGATAFATGLLALYVDWCRRHDLSRPTPEELRQWIQQYAYNLEGTRGNQHAGYGLLQLPPLSQLEAEWKQQKKAEKRGGKRKKGIKTWFGRLLER